MKKTAVILFNLGGPDDLSAVRPFLYNMFSDPAILRVSPLLRKPLAWLISRLRAKKARAIYRQIGGRSPLLEQTEAQAAALELELKEKGDYRVFTCMRYWHPMSNTVARNVRNFAPEKIILLPLYPQFSTATTASSFADWDRAAKEAELAATTTRICCYPADNHFVAAHVKLIKDAYWKASDKGKPRVLFVAHGLPEKIAADGDPYPWQVKETVTAITRVLAIDTLDYAICYQSRVGPLPWLTPYAEDELARAGADNVPVVMVPVSFVSEHSETLVDLDVSLRQVAEENGVPDYHRVPALSVDPLFIEALAHLCLNAETDEEVQPASGERFCPRNFEKCPCR